MRYVVKKAINDLEYWKKKLIGFLKDQERIGKSLSGFASSRLTKGRGMPVGTIQEWRGKKYKKVTPDKWARYYDKGEGRGVSQAIRNTIRKIEKASSMEELIQIIKENRTRFMENGKPAPVVQEFMNAVRGKVPKEKIPVSEDGKYQIKKFGDKYLVPGRISPTEYNVNSTRHKKLGEAKKKAEENRTLDKKRSNALKGKISKEIPSISIPEPSEENSTFAEAALEGEYEDLDDDTVDMINQYFDDQAEYRKNPIQELQLKMAQDYISIGEAVKRFNEQPVTAQEVNDDYSDTDREVMGLFNNGDYDTIIDKAQENPEYRKSLLKILEQQGENIPDQILQYIADEAKEKKTRGKDKKKRKSPVRASGLESSSDMYADTGYVAGSAKERAQERIKLMKEAGQNIGINDIDWNDLEENPRIAESLIKKSTVMGNPDWEALEKEGMDPGAGYLIDRVYASVATKPDSDALSRKDYVRGIETLRDRLEKVKTPEDVRSVISEIRSEYRGVKMSGEDQAEYDKISKEAYDLLNDNRELKRMNNEIRRSTEHLVISNDRLEKYKEIGDSVRVVYLEDNIKRITANLEEKMNRLDSYLKEKAGISIEETSKVKEYIDSKLSIENEKLKEVEEFKKEAMQKAWMSNDEARAWLNMGDRFHNILLGKSTAWRNNYFEVARYNKIKDWSWADKKKVSGGGTEPKKKTPKFKLFVSDSYERVGGSPVSVKSTQDLKDAFNLREVQSGNYVIKDLESAKFHVENTAGALIDLSDITGIPKDKIAMNGRLAMAFGARGKSGARAHYESTHRIINMTKMSGGGSLAHEWFHSFDNMIAEATGGGQSGFSFTTEGDASGIQDPELRGAFIELNKAMNEGNYRPMKRVSITDTDRTRAKLNLDNPTNDLAKSIKAAGNSADAVSVVLDHFEGRYESPRMRRTRSGWIKVAAAYFAPEDEKSIAVPTVGERISKFKFDSTKMDNGQTGKYWSQNLEMAARAFAGWTEDKLQSQGRKNDYLSNHSNNASYEDWTPYPGGEEKKKIYAAFDRMFDVIRKNDSIRKSLGLLDKKPF